MSEQEIRYMIEQEIINRMREIKKNREEFVKENIGIILSAPEFMAYVDKYAYSDSSSNKYLWCDNPMCALMGISDIDGYKDYYYCPVEDLSEEEIDRINFLKPPLPNI